MKRKLIANSLLGIVIGTTIGLWMSVIFSLVFAEGGYAPAPPIFTDRYSNPLQAMVISILLWSAIGVLFTLSGLIFSETDWSITKMTVIHLLVTYVIFLPLAMACGWLSLALPTILGFTALFLLIYLIMWLISMQIAKKQVAALNQRLKNTNDKK